MCVWFCIVVYSSVAYLRSFMVFHMFNDKSNDTACGAHRSIDVDNEPSIHSFDDSVKCKHIYNKYNLTRTQAHTFVRTTLHFGRQQVSQMHITHMCTCKWAQNVLKKELTILKLPLMTLLARVTLIRRIHTMCTCLFLCMCAQVSDASLWFYSTVVVVIRLTNKTDQFSPNLGIHFYRCIQKSV